MRVFVVAVAVTIIADFGGLQHVEAVDGDGNVSCWCWVFSFSQTGFVSLKRKNGIQTG